MNMKIFFLLIKPIVFRLWWKGNLKDQLCPLGVGFGLKVSCFALLCKFVLSAVFFLSRSLFSISRVLVLKLLMKKIKIFTIFTFV